MTVHNRRHFLKLSAGALAAPALQGPGMAQSSLAGGEAHSRHRAVLGREHHRHHRTHRS
jgi:hypothetical protein